MHTPLVGSVRAKRGPGIVLTRQSTSSCATRACRSAAERRGRPPPARATAGRHGGDGQEGGGEDRDRRRAVGALGRAVGVARGLRGA